MDTALSEELDILISIYGDAVEIKNGPPVKVIMQIMPSTADDLSAKHVWVTISFEIPPEYPLKFPKVELAKTRGLNQNQENDLLKKIAGLFEDRIGAAMLFDAIDAVKEYLTDNNHPSLECSICLEVMTRDVAFVKTECFHYFHPWCLSDCLKAVRETQDENINPCVDNNNGAWCPICRETLDISLEFLDSHERPPDDSDCLPNTKIELSAEFRKFQQQMQELLEKQRAQGGIIDTTCNSSVVIDISAASRTVVETQGEHSPVEVDSQMTHSKDSDVPEKPAPADEVPKNETPSVENSQPAKTEDPLTNDSKPDVAPSARLRGNSRNLNSSYPLNSRKSSKDFEVRPRNLSSSFSSSNSETPAVRIDHKYHDGRWRPRKKHDFEIRAELLEKSQSLDEEKRNAITADGENDEKSSAVVQKTCSDETDVNTKSDRPLKTSDQNKEHKHVTIHQTASNPPTENGESKPTRRIRQKPPPSLSVKSNRSMTFNQQYSEKEYYGYGYDQGQGQPEDWYYQAANDGSQSGNFYDSAEFYRNRHSYHGNSYRGKTGYQGRNRHKNSSGHYPPQHYFDASSSYDWEHWRSGCDRRINLSGSFSAQPSPKIYPRTKRDKYYSSSERQSFDDESGEPSPAHYNGHFQPKRSDSLASSGNGYLVTPNSPMLQPMPVLPAPSSADSANSDCVFTYYNGPASTPPVFAPYPMFE